MGSDFSTTRWSVVLSAGGHDEPAGREALAQLCRDYWHPVYVFIRRSGRNREEATDLTQEYFTRMIEREYLSDVEQGIAKFRSFLLASVKHFLANHRRDAAALKRGGGAPVLSLDAEDAEQWVRRHPADDRTPEDAYEYHWAVAVLDRARGRLRAEMQELGKEAQFEAAQGHLGAGEPLPHKQIAEKLGTSVDAAKMMVSRLRKRFGSVLRDEIAQTVESDEDVEQEIRYLLSILG